MILAILSGDPDDRPQVDHLVVPDDFDAKAAYGEYEMWLCWSYRPAQNTSLAIEYLNFGEWLLGKTECRVPNDGELSFFDETTEL